MTIVATARATARRVGTEVRYPFGAACSAWELHIHDGKSGALSGTSRPAIFYGGLMGHGGGNTPEEAALAGWADYPKAKARVVRVEHEGDDAVRVIIETDPHHLEYSYCVRGTDGRWREQISGGY